MSTPPGKILGRHVPLVSLELTLMLEAGLSDLYTSL